MQIKWRKAEGTQAEKPKEIDTESSPSCIYIRRNITRQTRNQDNNEETTYWSYDEAKLTRDEYNQYVTELSVADIQQQRADIDYIALMIGLDLEG